MWFANVSRAILMKNSVSVDCSEVKSNRPGHYDRNEVIRRYLRQSMSLRMHRCRLEKLNETTRSLEMKSRELKCDSPAQFRSVPRPIGSVGGGERHEGPLNGDLLVFSAGGPCEKFWHGHVHSLML